MYFACLTLFCKSLGEQSCTRVGDNSCARIWGQNSCAYIRIRNQYGYFFDCKGKIYILYYDYYSPKEGSRWNICVIHRIRLIKGTQSPVIFFFIIALIEKCVK